MAKKPEALDDLRTLRKAWKTSRPEAEFSVHAQGSDGVYVGMYRGGLVVRIGEQKKVAFLYPGLASRLGKMLLEMARLSESR